MQLTNGSNDLIMSATTNQHVLSPSAQQKTHPTFEWLRTEHIESLHILVSEYRHTPTGAMHYHIAANNDENVFLVGLRTIPTDSTGVAHILEHTALCGSKKYPVRDPFFMMIRRSLNTFMNAFTSSDWTAYPFASKNRKDFDNLLSVYLDAVFFSRLEPLDFAQEGHRLEFDEHDNPETDLVYKGVVYNEMKGAMSSPVSVIYETLSQYLFPTSTYHHNSGGDPETIPDLTYKQLKSFYKTHYHPSNAVFMTYGDMPASELQKAFEERALCHFERLDRHIQVHPEKRRFAPLKVQSAYAEELSEGESIDNKTHIVLGWLLGVSTDLESQLKAHLLSDVLLENSASPLRKLLETCGLGTSPSPLCGLEDSNFEMAFMCGIEGSSPKSAEEFETKVMDLLAEIAEKGVPQEKLEAVLHQLELSQREIGGDSYPYGLQLILSGLSPAIHRGDPIALLNLDPVLEKLRVEIKDPNFIPQLVKELLLENPHQVRLVMQPDENLETRKEQMIKRMLAEKKSQLSQREKQAIIDKAKALLVRQAQEDDESVLPKVGIEDVPAQTPVPKETTAKIANSQLSQYQQGTNGILYQQVVYPLPPLEPELQTLLPVFTTLVGELGAGNKDYLEVQEALSASTGGISGFSTLRGAVDDEQQVSGFLIYSGKALSRNVEPLSELMHSMINHPRFDELERIKELVAQYRARVDQSITGNGHGLAMQAASAGMNPAAKLSHQLSGLAGIQAIQHLDHELQNKDNLEAVADGLTVLHSLIHSGERQFLLVGEEQSIAEGTTCLEKLWQETTAPTPALALDPVREKINQAWLTNTQVNFCAKAYPTVPADHPDAPVLTVLGGVLRNGFLHRAIREQGGAYGGGASQDSNIAAFRFYSYRDPRTKETLADFDESIAWLLKQDLSYQVLEEAILGVIGSLDKPNSPAGEAKQAFQNKLFNRSEAFQARFRERVLGTTAEDLKRVAQCYFDPNAASTAIITSQAQWSTLDLTGFEELHV